jgi:3-deoxy-manno-octulosonate cytidylyltransferase (CMP-KDO synthetase)
MSPPSCKALHDEKEINDPNFVKVVKDLNGFVMYFSRSPVPYQRGSEKADYYEHIGVYAFRKEALLKFSRIAPTPNELAEKVEPIRFLETRHENQGIYHRLHGY